MKPITKLMVLAASLLLVNGTILAVLAANAHNGVYPISADSIGIPLAETAELSMICAALLASILGLSSLSLAFHRARSSRSWLLLAVGILALAYLLAVGFFTLWGLSWFSPHHYPIAASCGFAVGAILYLAVMDYRSLRPNKSFKSNQLSDSA